MIVLTYLLRVFNLLQLALGVSLHLLEHDFLGLVQHVLQEDDSALTRAHALDHTEVNVLALVDPIVAHQLEQLEHLTEVQILLSSDDVEHLVEVVLVLTSGSSYTNMLLNAFGNVLQADLRTTKVTSDVESSSVLLLNDSGGELEFGQIDDEATLLTLSQERLLLQRVEGLDASFSLEGLTAVDVKVDVQTTAKRK